MIRKLKYIGHSKKGVFRGKNQDRILIIDSKDFYFFAVFDGVSSYSESYRFVELYKREIITKIKHLDIEGKNLDRFLFDIHNEALKSKIKGASTLSAIFFPKNDHGGKYINIGDSRIYAFTNQFLEQITIDDSLETRSNVITKCLGSYELNLSDFQGHCLNKTYNYLLCTDGFHRLMENNIKEYFITLNFKKFGPIKRKISSMQRMKNDDDASYLIIKNEI